MPPLDGVKLQIFGKDKTAPVQTLVTQEDGDYKVGPLDGKVDYRYVLKKIFYYLNIDFDQRSHFSKIFYSKTF